MAEIFIEYPLMLLFAVAALGYLLGSVKVRGISLGVAAVLFTGLAFGAVNPQFDIPEIILLLGLSIFIYSIGLNSGPAFFESYRKNGPRDFIFIISTLLFVGVIAGALWFAFDFSAATISGIYTGSTTTTSALAGVIDYINNTQAPAEANANVQETVVGYSYSYVMGVLGGIIAIVVMERLFRIDYAKEAKALRKQYPVGGNLRSISIEVTQEAACGQQLRDLFQRYDWNLVFGRIFHDGKLRLADWSTTLELGDLVMLVGDEEDLGSATEVLGKRVDTSIHRDRNEYDVRRIFVSNPRATGRTIASLNIHEKYNAVITRIRRGDTEMLAKGDTVLELGDRVRFIARREDLDALSTFFGDSYQESSKVNLFSFGLGIGLGLLLGSFELSLGEGLSFKLGYAGGPLVVGLVFGALRRTGPIVWTLPYSANVTLQQIGLILLLAAIGVRSGQAFVQTVTVEGVWIFLSSVVLSFVAAFSILIVGYKLIKLPFSLLIGMVANQPAILDFASTRSKNRLPLYGYAMAFPIALVAKILISQILYLVLS